MKTHSFFLSFFLLLAIGCQKQEANPIQIQPNQTVDRISTQLTTEESEFLDMLKIQLENRSPLVDNRSVDPRNSNNPLDDLGEWLVNGLEYVNDFERNNINGSTDQQQYLAKLTEYQVNHPSNFNSISSTLSSEFQRQLHLLIKETVIDGEFVENIENLKVIEDAIANTDILDQSQKNAHFLTTTTLKFMGDFFENNDIYVNGTPVPSGYNRNWEDYYGECLQVLNGWEDHPIQTILAWDALPATLGICAAEAAWQEYWDED